MTVRCPYVPMVKSLQPGLVFPRAASDFLCLFLFPGPDLPKPAVISQLEQGAELWVADRGGSQACHPGKKPHQVGAPVVGDSRRPLEMHLREEYCFRALKTIPLLGGSQGVASDSEL